MGLRAPPRVPCACTRLLSCQVTEQSQWEVPTEGFRRAAADEGDVKQEEEEKPAVGGGAAAHDGGGDGEDELPKGWIELHTDAGLA